MLDLFSGIGGFSLAAEWVWGDELEIVAFCEIDKYCRKVLNKNFPSVPIYKDIKELDGEAFKDIDLITGGFPCQDISVAGKGAGIEGARSGLWSEMHRLISHIRPRYVIIENVPMLTVRGGTRVISDLAEIGMDAEWQIVGADDVGAWHRRKRIWIVAYPDSGLRGRRRTVGQSGENKIRRIHSQETQQAGNDLRGKTIGRSTVRGKTIPHPETVPLDSHSSVPGSHREEVQFHGETELRNQQVSDSGPVGAGVSRSGNDGKETDSGKGRNEDLAHPHRVGEKRDQSQDRQGIGTEQTRQDVPDTDSTGRRERRRSESVQETFHSSECDSQRFPADYWLSEPDVGRVADGIPSRVDRLKGLGNAIVPQVAIVIMELIKQADAKPQ